MNKISIVTVVLNDKTGIEKTIESILNQENNDYEYVVLDGGSVDGTLDVIKNYELKFKLKSVKYKYITQKDAGVYDAMNKVLDYVCGEYTIYMNSGDSFEHINVLEQISPFLDGFNDVVYGDTICVRDGWQWLQKAECYNKISEKIPFCHQSVFTKTELIEEYKYDLGYILCADYDMYLRMFLDNKVFLKTDVLVSRFIFGGVSSNDIGKTVLLENVDVRLNNGIICDEDAKRLRKMICKEHRINAMRLTIKNCIPKMILNVLLEKRYARRGWKRTTNNTSL